MSNERLDEKALAELERLEREATPGPWPRCVTPESWTIEDIATNAAEIVRGGGPRAHFCVHPDDAGDGEGRVVSMSGNGPTSEANAALVSAMRSALPSLLAEVRDLRSSRKDGGAAAEREACARRVEAVLARMRASVGDGQWSRIAPGVEKALADAAVAVRAGPILSEVMGAAASVEMEGERGDEARRLRRLMAEVYADGYQAGVDGDESAVLEVKDRLDEYLARLPVDVTFPAPAATGESAGPGTESTLHLYGQPAWHDDARIVGDRGALVQLRAAIDDALMVGGATFHTFAADGEGYSVNVERSEGMKKADHYTDLPGAAPPPPTGADPRAQGFREGVEAALAVIARIRVDAYDYGETDAGSKLGRTRDEVRALAPSSDPARALASPSGASTVAAVEFRPPTTIADTGTGQAITVEHPPRVTPRPPGPPSSPDRCKCGAVTLWRNPDPNASAVDPLTRIRHMRGACRPSSDTGSPDTHAERK